MSPSDGTKDAAAVAAATGGRKVLDEADARGHGNASRGAAAGAAAGALAGSFFGPAGAVVGGALGGGVGFLVGRRMDA
jgi:hypothetical protein